MKYLFVVGNVRSGTSLLVRLLNAHPNLFMSHESDILWLLYLHDQGLPFECYPGDSFDGASVALAWAGQFFDQDKSVPEIFEQVQRHLMRVGNTWPPGMEKSALACIGDKKPVQMTDPRLFEFTMRHFPEARFVHVIRDPADWLVSYNALVPEHGKTRAELLNIWMRNEQSVIELELGSRCLSFTYEELCLNTSSIIAQCLDLVGLTAESLRLEPTVFKSYRTDPLPGEVEDFWQARRESILA